MRKDSITKAWTLGNIKTFWDQKNIKVNTEYQREYCWSLYQQRLFLDSIIRGYDIPKIYFWDVDNSRSNYEIVDGQQRIATMIRFMENTFELSDDDSLGPLSLDKGNDLKGKNFKDFNATEVVLFNAINFDVVELVGFEEDEIKDMFVRQQEGSPLKAPEKRKPLPGNVSNIVQDLSEMDIFNKDKYLNYSNKYSAYRDSADKILNEFLNQKISAVTPAVLKKLYLDNKDLLGNDPAVKELKSVFSFLSSCFEGKRPNINKVELRRLSWIVKEFLKTYNLNDVKDEFGLAFIKFNQRRFEMRQSGNIELEISEYDNMIRSDGISGQAFIDDVLKRWLIEKTKGLKPKDPKRIFNDTEKAYIYNRDKGICKSCKKKIEFGECHADHIEPHSKGGETIIANGQLLCENCNLTKSNK